MATWQNLIDESRLYLYSGQRDALNTIGTAVADGTQAYIIATDPFGNSVRPGTILACGLELMLVTSTLVAAKQANVVRGYAGSPAYAHPVGAIVWVNPKFSEYSVWRAMQNELKALSSPQNGLFQVKTTAPVKDANGYYTFNPTGGFLSIWRVTSPADTQPYGLVRLRHDYVGSTLRLHQVGVYDSVNVYYRAKFDNPETAVGWVVPTSLADDVFVKSGLHEEAHDILPLGAAIRLVAPREVKRSFIEAQGDARRAEEVPPGTSIGATRALLALKAERIAEESERLAARYPYEG